MKKAIFFLLVSNIALAQVQTLPNSIGIGKFTLPAIPFHINNPNGSGEIARFQGGSPYISFFDNAIFKGYLQVIGNTFELGSKNNADMNFYTGNFPRLSINGLTGQAIFAERLNLFNGLKLYGSLIAAGESSGTEGMVLVSKGNNTPAWQEIPNWEGSGVGFSAYLTSPSTTIPYGTPIKLTNFTENFDDSNNFNPSKGEFIANSAGVYSFTLSPFIQNNTTIINDGRRESIGVIVRIFANNLIIFQNTKEVNISFHYGAGATSTALVKLNATDVVTFEVVQLSNSNQNIGGAYAPETILTGFKVY